MTLRPFHILAFTACASVTVIVGCKSDKDHANRGTTTAPVNSGGTGGTNTTTTPNPTTFDMAVANTDTETLAVADVVALAVMLTVTGPDPVELSSISVTASGSTDESQTLGELKLVGDDNGNGLLDAGEPTLATVAAPAFPTDDATVSIAFTNTMTIAGGASLSLLVTVDATPAAATALSHVGETIILSINTAADVTATHNGQAITPGNNFPLSSGTTTLYLHDTLLISEVVRMGTADEYIELFNPTGKPIDLSEIYITDATNSTTPYTFSYHNLPTGTGFHAASSADFMVRFPAGATIDPGQTITVAMDGAGFEGVYTQAADYSLRNPSGGSVDMLEADTANPPTWAAPASGITGGLTNNGEPVVVFRWDGQSDLVQDVDYFFYGTESSTNTKIEKDGNISIDGPDSDTNPSTYLSDTATFQQPDFLTGSFPSNAISRVEFTEAGETLTGGNGIAGHDETSEPFDVNWANAAPTPGTP